MGYILPINHEQYNEYTKQVAQKEKPAFTLEKVFKTTIENKLKGKPQEYEQDHTLEKYNPTTLINDVDDNTIDYYLADLEGKGQNFNETV